MNFLSLLNSFLWEKLLLVPLLLCGIFLTIKSGFYPVRRFGEIMKSTLGGLFVKRERGTVSPFKAVSAALAGTMGVGNIAGVATAITAGGPGAVFWMWMSAFFSMIIKYSEIVLSMKYRYRKDGGWVGGAMVCMDRGMKNPALAYVFAVACVAASFGTGNLSQSNTASTALDDAFGIPAVVSGLALALLCALALSGGTGRIFNITSVFVPVSSAVYILGALAVLFINLHEIPKALEEIFRSAFGLRQAGGGVAGWAVMQSMKFGVSRGLFTNEAGLGSAPIAHSASDAKTPEEQGRWGIIEVFLDTLVVCTLTALVIIVTGSHKIIGLDGVGLTSEAFRSVFGDGAVVFIALSVLLFAYSSIIGWSYYAQSCIRYMTSRKWVLSVYKFVYVAAVLVGCVSNIGFVWSLSDILNALMLIPNMYMVMRLYKQTLP